MKKLTEKELELIFSDRKKRFKESFVFKGIKYFGLFILSIAVVYCALNFNSLKIKTSYWYNNDFKSEAPADNGQNPNSSSYIISKPNMATIDDSSIYIAAINIKAPILWHTSNTPKSVSENLLKGVIQIDGTALPGEAGNVFITGHSSNYPWLKGKYNSVFALLDKLVIGDKIQLRYNNIDYLYEVFDTKIVSPDDVSVMQKTEDQRLTLMTCVPVGTNLRRLIVSAKQIYP